MNNPRRLETTTRRRSAKPPLWREFFAGFDWLALRASPVYRGVNVPRGDGSPVIVIPGLFATDSCLRELHSWLGRMGYRPYYSGIGLNARCPDLSVELLLQTIDRALRETGCKVTLVGHSLGGLLARSAAMRRPGAVARVVTLGSPVNGIGAHPLVLAAAEAVRGACDGDCLRALQGPLPRGISETNIYTPDDGVVDWTTCFREDAEAIAVSATHVGLIFNPQAFQAVGEALAGTVGQGFTLSPKLANPVDEAADAVNASRLRLLRRTHRTPCDRSAPQTSERGSRAA